MAERPTTPSETPDELARYLAKRSAWPGEAGPIEALQTHISHVFLVGDRVYKLRKAVRLPFLDFGERTARNADCLREIELNRRLSPSVYLGIAPIVHEAGRTCIGPVTDELVDAELEHVVVMRRLPSRCDALSMLERGELRAEHLEAIAERLQIFHASHGLGRPAPWSRKEWRERIAAPTLASADAIRESDLVPAERIAAIDSSIRNRLDAIAEPLERRRFEGRAVDGHGDLHLDHVWFEPESTSPCLIDCLEFDDDLRRIDSASEVAFLAMDLRYRRRADLAEYFLSSYASRCDDYGLYSVVDFFAAYRSLVRAKVAALAALQSSIPARQRDAARNSLEEHLVLAESLLVPPKETAIVLLCGTVGCGKSSVARRLASIGRGVPIVSDRLRKVLADISPETDTSALPDQGLYRPEQREHVYRAMLERAAPILDGGRTAILDASFTQRTQRDLARSWAAARGVAIRLIEVVCAPEIALHRLGVRSEAGTDPSDAGPSFLATSLARFEPPEEWPPETHQVVRTDETGWEQQLAEQPLGATHRPT